MTRFEAESTVAESYMRRRVVASYGDMVELVKYWKSDYIANGELVMVDCHASNFPLQAIDCGGNAILLEDIITSDTKQ